MIDLDDIRTVDLVWWILLFPFMLAAVLFFELKDKIKGE